MKGRANRTWTFLGAGVIAAGTALVGCAELLGRTRSGFVGDVPCPPGSQKAGEPPPKGNIEACVTECGMAPPQGSTAQQAEAWGRFDLRRACLNGPYRSWTSDGKLRATGEMQGIVGPAGKWEFFAEDGIKALTCDLDRAPVPCTEWRAGSAADASPLPLKFYIGDLADLMDRSGRMAVDLLDANGQLRERRVYSPNGTLMVQCPPTHVANYHEYTKDRPSPDQHDFEAYCIKPPSNACPPEHDPCVKYMGLHCEMQGGDAKCIDDAAVMDGVYRYWSFGRNLTEEGSYAAGTKVGSWTRFQGAAKEVTMYDDQGRRTSVRQSSADGGVLWEATYEGERLETVVRALPDNARLRIKAAGAKYPYSCEFLGSDDNVTASGPCSSDDPIQGDVLKQGTWNEMAGDKPGTVRYVDGVPEGERREAERRAKAEAEEQKREEERLARERQAAIARGECTFEGIDGVECELRLCAKVAAKVKTMSPTSSCPDGEPYTTLFSDWQRSMTTIDRYAGLLRARGDAPAFIRLQRRIEQCVTPAWFRTCSN